MREEDLNKDTGSDPGRQPARLQTLRRWARRLAPLALIALAALLGVILYDALFPTPVPPSMAEIDESIVQAMASATPPPAYSAQVYQVILPSLVFIKTQSDDPGKEEGIGVGSGVVIDDQGDILTALHVVEDATEIAIVFADGSESSADIVSSEPEMDIAVLHPHEPPGLIVPAVLGNPNNMRVGDEAFAVGNPLGLAGSMSAGVISGFDRTLPANEDGRQFEGLIQFDAAVNPGNSGGPLLNRRGQVIGIVTALADPTERGSFTGIGFAVPIVTAVAVAGAPAY
jgi:S1-C subfamily serine protease